MPNEKTIKPRKTRFPIRESELDRFKAGKQKYGELSLLKKGSAPFCLDVACGSKPFPQANVLCDLYAEPVPDRRMRGLVTEGKPFVQCSCSYLPFKKEAFDFVTSYYLIEHTIDPVNFLKELKRVSKHGYVQCPSWFNELLYGEGVHHWIVLKRDKKLFVKPIKQGTLSPFKLGFLFHRLYQHHTWRILHAILDEQFHLFSIHYDF